jgi:hypothetical protein
MKIWMTCISTSLVAGSVLIGSLPARALTVAGWDFSQWAGSGLLSTDNASLTNTLAANYSNLDPTGNAGAESATFGRLYFDGQFGSTAVGPVGDGSEAFTPVAGSLRSNLEGPVRMFGDNPFESHSILRSEGQGRSGRMSMAAAAPVQVVFRADPPLAGTNWVVGFAGRAASNSQLAIDFSSDGAGYTNVGTVNLTPTDTRFELNLAGGASDQGFVRFRFTPPADGPQLIDNVAIQSTTGLPGDQDADHISDAADRCPFFANRNQADLDGDGRGDVCECTDQNGDGRNTVSDLVAINIAIFNPAQRTPLCDGNNDGNCDVNDIIASNIEIFSPGSTSICSRQPVPGP